MNGRRRPVLRRRDERGAGTILHMAIAWFLLAGTLLCIWGIGWVTSVMRSERVADMAAVSGAQAALEGRDGCAQARETAQRNGGSLTGCTLKGQVPAFVLVVKVRVRLLPPIPYKGLPRAVEGEAAAGPATITGRR